MIKWSDYQWSGFHMGLFKNTIINVDNSSKELEELLSTIKMTNSKGFVNVNEEVYHRGCGHNLGPDMSYIRRRLCLVKKND